MEKCEKIAALYIATLKAMAIIHQQNHWLTKGSNFYGDHLLFERLYSGTLENLDAAAEKFIGVFGDACMSYDMQADLLNKVLLKYKNLEGSPAEMSLAVEKEFLKFSEEAHACFEREGRMTLGLDDLLCAISSKREESVYLLKQVLNGE
jgi:DNA-binding ferritin-like protein